ncbi:hypothetical protein KsCSTR_31880 [Candidatus Kuenenia stuttgartiensis]|uniref:Uncharacterized protein n=1 Tax=Kuenenia stuttgartiensis TaxID=174633 RepID=Q1Q4V0_KUEST|nr:hypothetical protein KsCSTR_31880 [Candidatus Kuenenia stuttgartiensis]CAJ75039.1 unknown protein [Candidatus Kuenenia stuttgartiensis]
MGRASSHYAEGLTPFSFPSSDLGTYVPWKLLLPFNNKYWDQKTPFVNRMFPFCVQTHLHIRDSFCQNTKQPGKLSDIFLTDICPLYTNRSWHSQKQTSTR